jgi:hypothetical protein
VLQLGPKFTSKTERVKGNKGRMGTKMIIQFLLLNGFLQIIAAASSPSSFSSNMANGADDNKGKLGGFMLPSKLASTWDFLPLILGTFTQQDSSATSSRN